MKKRVDDMLMAKSTQKKQRFLNMQFIGAKLRVSKTVNSGGTKTRVILFLSQRNILKKNNNTLQFS